MLENGSYPWSAGFQSLTEERELRLHVDGRIPSALRGTLYRNGPGRNKLAGEWFPHWFDGDGLIQAYTVSDQGIFHQRRFVRTRNYADETAAQRSLYRGFGKMRPGGLLANFLRQPENVSNTSVVMQAGRLFSLWEGGPPYELDPVTLGTKGVSTFGGTVEAFSAHPKTDAATGELFNFGIDYGRQATLTPYRMKDGVVTRLGQITLPFPFMNHDFVLTERHLVFCLGSILVKSLPMILGLTSFDGALHWDGGKPTLLLLVPRDGRSAPRFIELPAFFQFHFANGFERDNTLTIDLARYPDYVAIGEVLRSYWQSDWTTRDMARLVRLTVDLASGKSEMRDYPSGSTNEFPRIHPGFVGRPYRYAWIACNAADCPEGLHQQIARVDVETGKVITHDFGPDCYTGEPLFVPTGTGGEEDDGVVVATLFDARRKSSILVGLDGRDPAARPLFTAPLDAALPFALHGFFQPAA